MRWMGFLIFIVFYGLYAYKYFTKKDRMEEAPVTESQRNMQIASEIVSYALPVWQFVSLVSNWHGLPGFFRWVGLIIALAGTYAYVRSVVDLKGAWSAGVTAKKDPALVTNGIYAWSRNPACLGFDLTAIGLLLMFFNWILLILTAAALLLFHKQITGVEEGHLADEFGEAYAYYKDQVRRYFGKKTTKA